ncbi:hypothetical protein GCM10020369_41570 [Cryptosporangium minutisporangium]|uniref:Uncharacterized protein n=1 Tax=Cryptosporangium minutisporangium TaxID=113569 RepID=A0ABP6T1B9_9ACTN
MGSAGVGFVRVFQRLPDLVEGAARTRVRKRSIARLVEGVEGVEAQPTAGSGFGRVTLVTEGHSPLDCAFTHRFRAPPIGPARSARWF